MRKRIFEPTAFQKSISTKCQVRLACWPWSITINVIIIMKNFFFVRFDRSPWSVDISARLTNASCGTFRSLLPERPIYNFESSKTIASRFWTSRNWPISCFSRSKTVKGPVGLCLRVIWQFSWLLEHSSVFEADRPADPSPARLCCFFSFSLSAEPITRHTI